MQKNAKSITYNYDQDVDILYISFQQDVKATTAIELNDYVLLRYNREALRPVGLTLMDFSVLVQPTELGVRHFPLNGLDDLDKERRDEVLDLINRSPVNQILKLGSYIAHNNGALPIHSVENPLIPA